MTISSVLGNVLIDGNSITSGNNTSGTIYYYTSAALINADAMITNNTFSGVASLGGAFGNDMLQLSNCTSHVSHNTFVRSINSLRSYIYDLSNTTFSILPPFDHVIVDNIFDSSTVDGTDELLAKTLTIGSTYERNKNQISYVAVQVSKYDVTWLQSPDFMSERVNAYPTTFLAQTIYEQVTVDSLNFAAIGNAKVTFDIDLGELIPSGVQIISAAVGFAFNGSPDLDVSSSTNQFGFTLYNSISQQYSLSSLPLSYVDVYHKAIISSSFGGANLGTSNVISISTPTQLTSALNQTNYLTLDLSSTPVYQTTLNKLFAQLQYNIFLENSSITGKAAFILTSPFVVRFRY